jgi:hypothetical protein
MADLWRLPHTAIRVQSMVQLKCAAVVCHAGHCAYVCRNAQVCCVCACVMAQICSLSDVVDQVGDGVQEGCVHFETCGGGRQGGGVGGLRDGCFAESPYGVQVMVACQTCRSELAMQACYK